MSTVNISGLSRGEKILIGLPLDISRIPESQLTGDQGFQIAILLNQKVNSRHMINCCAIEAVNDELKALNEIAKPGARPLSLIKESEFYPLKATMGYKKTDMIDIYSYGYILDMVSERNDVELRMYILTFVGYERHLIVLGSGNLQASPLFIIHRDNHFISGRKVGITELIRSMNNVRAVPFEEFCAKYLAV